MAKKTTDTAPAAKSATIPRISVLERRLQNPFGEGSPPIRLKEPGWTLHVVNGALRPGRYHDVVRNKGWVPVAPEEIEGEAIDFGFDVKDGRVVRGERGQEVLVKMPTADYALIAQAKDDANARQLASKKVKSDLAQKVAATFGDEAGAFAHDSISVNATRSPIPLDDADGTA
jgi:hypothetical protein